MKSGEAQERAAKIGQQLHPSSQLITSQQKHNPQKNI